MDSSRIFVKGLPASLTVEEFRSHFSKQSPITDAKFIPRRRIGYVGFRTPVDASRAVQYYNKSFIRMSKIGVELAKSVDEQQKYLRPSRSGANNIPVPTAHGILNHYGDEDNGIDATARTVKKRRLSTNHDEDDDKLQEFLQVMRPPSKFRNWDNQGAFTDPLSTITAPSLRVQNDLMTEDKGDIEYEPIVSKQPKWQDKDDGLEEHAMPTQNDENEHQSLETVDGEKMALQSREGVALATSDEDWLRSRTSRLLGLAGDEEDDRVQFGPESQRMSRVIESSGRERVDARPNIKRDSRGGREGAREGEGGDEDEERKEREPTSAAAEQATPDIEQFDVGLGRLFLRNLTYTSTEDDIRNHFESKGFEGIDEVHLPLDFRVGNNSNKGFAHVQFANSQTALSAMRELDQKPFQGRLLHILPADPKPADALDEFEISKLSHKQQQRIRRKAETSSSTFNWNSMYMNSNAVMSSVADRLRVSKSELLDPTSSDAAVKQAHAETHIIQETKSYFANNGVDLEAFKRHERGISAILVKNFPYGTEIDELRNLFDTYGPLKRLLMPPSGTIAIVEFEQGDHARSAFGSLSYSKFKDSVLFLEKAPKDLFTVVKRNDETNAVSGSEVRQVKPSTMDLLGEGDMSVATTTTLFVRNLSFSTTEERLREALKSLDGFVSARIKTKPDPKIKGATLSMGFGFLEFRSKKQAQAAMAVMDNYKLDGHELLVRASHKAVDAAEERRNVDRATKIAERRTKIIIKNLPFEATKKDIRSLFGAYGQLRSVRVPKKFDSSTRGFAFADFITVREAENAMDALKDTHLLGRRLILQFATGDEVEPEAAIEQMQRKVGKQVDKVALQKLTGTGRKKFNVVDGVDDGLDQLVD